jgi:hypothetical protein
MGLPSWGQESFTSRFRLLSAATVNNTLVRAGPAKLGWLVAGNVGATVAYVKIFDKATIPAAGTDIPILTYMIPGSTVGGVPQIIPIRLPIFLGFGFAITGLMIDSDATVVALNQVNVNFSYF